MTVKRVRLLRDYGINGLKKGDTFNVLEEEHSTYTIEYEYGWTHSSGKRGWNVLKGDFKVVHDDPCGDCKNMCRSGKKCPFYQEEEIFK